MIRYRDHVAGFWAKVNKTDSCWHWTAALSPKGYGEFHKGTAHRYAYQMLVGPIPKHLVVDHLCRNRACVNPEHMELVTAVENTKRGKPIYQTQCKRGHELSGDNVRPHSKTGARVCRQCMKEYQRDWMRRKRGVSSRGWITPTLAEAVIAERSKGISYEQLAKQFGISMASAWKIVNGKWKSKVLLETPPSC